MLYVIIFLFLLNTYAEDTIKKYSIIKHGRPVSTKIFDEGILSEARNDKKKFKRLIVFDNNLKSEKIFLQKHFKLHVFYKNKNSSSKVNSFFITREEGRKENNEKIKTIIVQYFSKNNIQNMFEYFLEEKMGKSENKTEIVIIINNNEYVAPIYNAHFSQNLGFLSHTNNKNNLNILKLQNWTDEDDL
jgi:hypothetical protein